MTALGFTGTRYFTTTDMLTFILVEDRLHDDMGLWTWIADHDEFITGGCVGFDAIMGATLARWPTLREARHVVIVPADRSRVDPWWQDPDLDGRVTVIEMPDGSSYRERDQAIVDRADELFYVAHRHERHGSQKRSGTWLTVRLARQKGIPLRGIVMKDEE